MKLISIHPRQSLWQVDNPGLHDADLHDYFALHQKTISDIVAGGGGVYFQGFPLADRRAFHQVISIINPHFLPYTGAKVREEGASHLYRPTSTPNFRKNFLHNEMAYQRDIPPTIFLYCAQPAPEGGASLLGDQREVYAAIPKAIRSEFESRKLMFVRKLVNDSTAHRWLTKNFDLMAIMPSWQGNFATTDRAHAEQVCKQAGFDVEWNPRGQMIIRCTIEPTRPHPTTGEPMWVNNAHLFQLHAGVYGPLLYTLFKAASLFSRDTMTTCLYGDGTSIPANVIQAVLDATENSEVRLPLNRGDFVYANNHAISHGRETFKGARELYFGLAQ